MTGGDEPQYPGFDDNFIANIQPTLIPRLEKVFAEIYKAAPSASIVVSTYPQIFPATYNGPCSEGFGPTTLWLITSSNELTRFRELTSNINAAIIAAAAVSTNVSVLPVENLFSGHELCTSDPWVNAVKGYINTTGTYDDESLHPTTAGYAAWASAVKNYFGF